MLQKPGFHVRVFCIAARRGRHLRVGKGYTSQLLYYNVPATVTMAGHFICMSREKGIEKPHLLVTTILWTCLAVSFALRTAGPE